MGGQNVPELGVAEFVSYTGKYGLDKELNIFSYISLFLYGIVIVKPCLDIASTWRGERYPVLQFTVINGNTHNIKMNSEVTVVTNPTVNVRLTNTLSSFEASRRFKKSITIAEFKELLEMIVGLPPTSIDLELFSVSDAFLQKLDDNEALLGSYPVDDNCRIHVIDRSGAHQGEFTDVSKVEKFEISDDAYEKRTDSVRSYKKQMRIGRFNEEEMAKKEAILAEQEAEEKTAADAITVGSRCQVQVTGQPSKIGTVMYVGTTDFKPGHWVGVKYDEPLGKNDGSVNGKKYFECENKYGAFVKPLNVIVGDFPEEDYGLDEI